MMRFFCSKMFIWLAVCLATPAHAADLLFTQVDVPNAMGTETTGINDLGQIAGSYFTQGPTLGYYVSAGAFNTVDVGGGSPFTVINGINNYGQMVGYYGDSLQTPHNFLYPPNLGGVIITIDPPHSKSSGAFGINNVLGFGGFGQSVGIYTADGSVPGMKMGTNYGFLQSSGSFTTIQPPGILFSFAYGINDHGQIVGSFIDPIAGNGRGYLDDTVAKTFAPVDVPGSQSTQPTAINNGGEIVGYFEDDKGHRHGFIVNSGVFTTIDVPGATLTEILGLNNAGQLVGAYSTGVGITHGFIASPQGASPDLPFLPTAVNPSGTFVFINAPSRAWLDPNTAFGYHYAMVGSGLFTEILDFPTGFALPFDVTVPGCTIPGTWTPGESLDFVALCGHAVSEFTITGIEPLVDPSNQQAFPIRLAFDTPTASFTADPLNEPAPVSEPASLVLLTSAVGFAHLYRRRGSTGR